MRHERELPQGAPRRGRADVRASVTAVFAVACVTVCGVLIGWAALAGPSAVLTGDGIERASHQVQTPTTTTTATTTATASPAESAVSGASSSAPWLVHVLAYALSALVLGLMLVAAVAALRWFWSQRGRSLLLPGDQIDFETLDVPAAAAVILEDEDVQALLLASGESRNAIVECWDRFQRQAEAVGVRARGWETSSEFTVRLLGQVHADPRAVSELAERFREARFSPHPITEADRASALQALAAIHASLRRVAAQRREQHVDP